MNIQFTSAYTYIYLSQNIKAKTTLPTSTVGGNCENCMDMCVLCGTL